MEPKELGVKRCFDGAASAARAIQDQGLDEGQARLLKAYGMMLQDFAQVTKHNINEVKAELKETENDVLELGKKCRKTKRMDAI